MSARLSVLHGCPRHSFVKCEVFARLASGLSQENTSNERMFKDTINTPFASRDPTTQSFAAPRQHQLPYLSLGVLSGADHFTVSCVEILTRPLAFKPPSYPLWVASVQHTTSHGSNTPKNRNTRCQCIPSYLHRLETLVRMSTQGRILPDSTQSWQQQSKGQRTRPCGR